MEIFYFSIREKREMDFIKYSINGKLENHFHLDFSFSLFLLFY
jgi:hypothetical protein